MRSIGIDLGEDSIKLVELVQSKKHVHLQSVFEKKLSSTSTEHDREIEAIEFVRQILNQFDFANARFIMALRQDKVTVRTKTFPFSDRIKIQKSLAFEMEEDIPFDTDNCIFDYKVISYDGPTCTVLAVAVPKVHIEKCLSLAKDFGLELHALSVEGLAFANLVENWEEAPPVQKTQFQDLKSSDPSAHTSEEPRKPAHVFLNIGHRRTLVLGVMNRRVIFVRSLIWGADQILQEMLRKYQLPYAEAQKMLQQKLSLPLNKHNKSFEELNLAAVVEKSLRDLVRDLQISFLEMQSDHKAHIESVSFCGGLSQLPHLGAFLTQHLEVACNPVDLLGPYTHERSYAEKSLRDIQSRFAVATGIALEAYKKPRNPALQFIRGEYAGTNNRLKALWQEWGSIVQISAAALIVLFVWTYLRQDFSTTLAEKGEESLKAQAKSVARLPKNKANEKGVTQYIKDNKKRAQDMKLVSQIASMNSAMDIIKKLSETAPGKTQAQIDLIQLHVSDDEVRLSGYANSPREVSLLTERLTPLSINKKIAQETPTLAVLPNRVAFSLNFKVDRGLVK